MFKVEVIHGPPLFTGHVVHIVTFVRERVIFGGIVLLLQNPLQVNLGSYTLSVHTIFKDTKRDFRNLFKHAHK